MSDEWLNNIVNGLLHINPNNKGTLNFIDIGLTELLKRNAYMGIKFLEDLVLIHSGNLSLETFDSVISQLLKTENIDILNRLSTRWLMSGERVLCQSISQIINHSYKSDIILSVEPSEININDPVSPIFLVRKAIGYLFFHPITVTSIIISLMKLVKDDEVMQSLNDLLFDPLLINYPKKVKEYLMEQKDVLPVKVQAVIESILNDFDDYINNLNNTPEIPELFPSQIQRDIYHSNLNRKFSESMKKAEKESVLWSLISKCTVLYGKKSIYHNYSEGEHSNRMEMPLHSHGFEVQLPRMYSFDPCGLDFLLRVYKAEVISCHETDC